MTWSPNLIELVDTNTPYEEKVDVISSVRTIYGRTKEKDASTAASVWQIWVIDGIEGIATFKHFALKDSIENSDFVHIWDDRVSLFSPVIADFSTPTYIDGGGENGLNFNANQATGQIHAAVYRSKLYVAFSEDGVSASFNIRVVEYNGNDLSPSWTFIDGDGLNFDPNTLADYPKMAVFNNKLYILWTESVPTSHIHVYKYNDNSTWSAIDGGTVDGLNHDPTKSAIFRDHSLISANSKLYAAWSELDGAGSGINQIRVAEYNGSSWTFIDGDGNTGINVDTAAHATEVELVDIGTKIYAIWVEGTTLGGKIRVRVYNGVSWTTVDNGGLLFNASEIASQPTATVSNGKLYVTWQEDNAGDGEYEIRVAVYNGNDGSPAWNHVDGNTNTGLRRTNNAAFLVRNPEIIDLEGILYLTFEQRDSASIKRLRALMYNGNDVIPVWTYIDGDADNIGINKDNSKDAKDATIVGFQSKVYAFWAEKIEAGVYNIMGSVGI